MKSISKSELRELAGYGEGVILVDRDHQEQDRASTLHDVRCKWPRQTSSRTPLLFAPNIRAAITWLIANRGTEGERWKRCNTCHASNERRIDSADSQSTDPDGRSNDGPKRFLGQPVWTTDRGQALSWVTAVEPDLRVAAFDSPNNDMVGDRAIDPIATGRFLPRTGDRCFAEMAGVWSPAICKEDVEDVEQLVPISRDGVEMFVPLTELRFRRLEPLESPLAELSDQRVGSTVRFRARARFLESYWNLARPSRGLLGVSSAAVDLHPHQVGVARRVLSDPVQRYLLADEVGLGKTIEAGFVIRQRLIDAPRSVVRVVVPNALVWQWDSELEEKFGVSQFGGVELRGFDDPHAFDVITAPDLLIIDEAHRIAAGWNSPAKEYADRFNDARALAHQVPRILLLSATPVLHREADLLAMLHLLDPDTYRLEDVEIFKARVRDREQIGELLLALRPGAPTFVIRSRLPDLKATFPNDNRLSDLTDRIEALLDGDSKEREAAMADARSHISDTYRLHRRLLRNRRSTIEGSGYHVRGRLGVKVLRDSDPRREEVDAWLERWRLTLLEDAYELEGDDLVERACQAFLVYAGCASGDLGTLRALALLRLTRRREYLESAGIDPAESSTMRAFPLSDRQRADLKHVIDLLDDTDTSPAATLTRIARSITELNEAAIVVFVSSPTAADALKDALGDSAETYTTNRSDFERRMYATAFKHGVGRRILICDRTGEEGVNLQEADCIVHVDLPLNTTRIEQRVGRVDRHGQTAPVTNFVIDPGPDGGFGKWWFDALTASFEVFDATTAPVQYAIEAVQAELLRTVAREGVDQARSALDAVKTRLEAEQGRIDRLDSLDALARQDADDVEFAEQVRTRESEAANAFAEAVVSAITAIQTDLEVDVDQYSENEYAVCFLSTPPALRVYSNVAELEVVATASRDKAVEDPGLTVLRPGNPIVEALRLQLAADERCQTTATWIQGEVYDEPMLAIRCDVIARADSAPAFAAWKQLEAGRPRSAKAIRTDADAPLANGALQRRLDAYLPPQFKQIWIDRYGTRIEDTQLIQRLNESLAGADDQGLTGEQWTEIVREAGVLSIDDVLMPLQTSLSELVLTESSLIDAASRAVERASSDLADAQRALRLRAEVNFAGSIAGRDFEDERVVSEFLLRALKAPVIEWSGAAFVYVAGGNQTQ